VGEIRDGKIDADREECIAIWLAAIEARDGRQPEFGIADRVRSMFDCSIVRFAVAGEPISGFCLTVEEDTPGESRAALLQLLASDPRNPTPGTGRRLLADSIAASRAAGYGFLRLEVRAGNDRAIDLYERAGFAADGSVREHPLGGAPLVSYWMRLGVG
jgi:ribosomal protein S18 acetylase RimI-like enzyme